MILRVSLCSEFDAMHVSMQGGWDVVVLFVKKEKKES